MYCFSANVQHLGMPAPSVQSRLRSHVVFPTSSQGGPGHVSEGKGFLEGFPVVMLFPEGTVHLKALVAQRRKWFWTTVMMEKPISAFSWVCSCGRGKGIGVGIVNLCFASDFLSHFLSLSLCFHIFKIMGWCNLSGPLEIWVKLPGSPVLLRLLNSCLPRPWNFSCTCH